MMMEGRTKILEFQGDPKDRFLYYIKQHLSAILSNRQSFQIYLNYRHYLDEESRSFYKEMDISYLEFFCDIFYSAYPHYKELDYMVPYGTVLCVLNLLNTIPKNISSDLESYDFAVNDICQRITAGLAAGA